MKKWISLLLLLAMLVSVLAGCGAEKATPTALELPQADNVAGKPVDMTYETAYMNLTMELLQRSAAEKQGENVMISPLSVQLALAMTANGADGKTLREMEEVLGQGISINEMNEYLLGYLYDFNDGLTRDDGGKLQIANSVWLRNEEDKLQVNEGFLQNVSNYYAAEVYSRPFDKGTVDEINGWVAEKTDGMIPKVLEKIDSDSMLYLINAMTFDGEWAAPYDEYAIRDGEFTALSGKQQTVAMMHGEEALYLEDNRATGFIKPYSGGRYGFALLLPGEGIDVYDYLDGLTADSLSQTLAEAQECTVITQMPKFSYAFDLSMNDVLKDMGMSTAFDSGSADLSRLGSSDMGNLYIGNVLHKTFIRVDGMGTQAGAVTVVEVAAEGAWEPEVVKEVVADRPFVYMILDMENNLPIFIGCVTEVTE